MICNIMQHNTVFFSVNSRKKVADHAKSNNKKETSMAIISSSLSFTEPKQGSIALSKAREALLTNSRTTTSSVENFRVSAGCQNIYRSACPDKLGGLLAQTGPLEKRDWLESERIVLFDATLLIDLRMESEIQVEEYKSLAQLAPGGPFEAVSCLEDLTNSSAKRQCFRPAGAYGLTKPDLLTYAGKKWVPSRTWNEADLPQKKQLFLEELNKRGLAGLYEIILETKLYICVVLKAITIHLERHRNGKVVYHCSIGKDRTGCIAMLCGKMLGTSDSEIDDDFAQSESIRELAETKFRDMFGDGVDVAEFARSRKESMQATVEYVQSSYGSVSQYLDSIGFDSEWQSRFRNAAC